MKTNINNIILTILLLVLVAFSELNICAASTNRYNAFRYHQSVNSKYFDHGFEVSIPRSIPENVYPIVYFSGINLNEAHDFLRRNPTATEPANHDSRGNWGEPVDDLQLSLRFESKGYTQAEPVQALIILRNLSRTNSFPAGTNQWWRNALPDHGYVLKIYHGTNSVVLERPQRPLPKLEWHDDGFQFFQKTDPYCAYIAPHVQELTVINLKGFFNFSKVGKYTVRTETSIPAFDGSKAAELVSGAATFEVLSPETALKPKK